MRPPAFDQDLCLLQTVEDFAVQKLVSELAIKAFIVTIFPRRTWRDEESLDLHLFKPFAHSNGRELRPIIRTNVLGRAMLGEQVCENSQHIIMLEIPLDMDGEALSRVLINDSEHAESPPIVRPVSHEVIGPNMPLVLRPQPHAGSVVKPEPSTLGLLLWDFKPLASPYPFNPFEVYVPAFAPK
jgi:hypothetical protein